MVYNMKNIKYIPTTLLTLSTIVSGAALASAPALAANTGSKTAVVNVSPACSFTAGDGYTANLSLAAGASATTESDTKADIEVTCNSLAGFSVQAVGFSPDATHADGEDGNTSLYSTVGVIPTGTTGTGSRWAFKVTSATSTTSYNILYGYNDYSDVPNIPTGVVSYGAPTSSGYVTGTLRTDYQVYVSSDQASGAYSGKVKYIVVINT
jgi:hypothetical protein